MLDVREIRENPKLISEKLAKRGVNIDFTEFLAADETRRKLIFETDQLKAERNKTSAEVPMMKKNGEDTTAAIARMKQVGEEIKQNDQELLRLKEKTQHFLDQLPNIPADDVVAGGKENNEVIKVFGEKPNFNFQPKHHVDLVEACGLIDYERGVKLAGNGYWLYRADGARLEWAMLNYFINSHLADNYEMILPPHILNYQCGYTAGQFPKFADDVYQLKNNAEEAGNQFILPTAETALVNVHRDEILDEETLPRKYFAFTPCYRKEAGGGHAEERGMIRGHQFNKIEMFQYTKPEDSAAALQELIKKAAQLVEGLGLHFRLTKLAAGDCSASMMTTYDIEVWIPSMNEYKEVSSASNAGAFQARRGNIRYRDKTTNRPEFLHTLNASGLATSRILPAIVEQYQQEDGSIVVPEVLRPYLGGKELIEPLCKA